MFDARVSESLQTNSSGLKDIHIQSGLFFLQSRNWRRYTALAVPTVRRAIAQLAEEGYVKVKQGHGTIVLKSIYPTDAFEYSRLHHFEDILSIRHVNIPNPEQMSARGMYIDSVASDETISQVLEIPVGTMVYRIQRIFYSGDNPLMFLNNYLRMDFFPNLDRWTEQFWDLYPFLVQHYNIQYQGCSEYISAVSADLVDAQILHIIRWIPLHKRRESQDAILDRI